MTEIQIQNFHTTRWTQVVAARGTSAEAKHALHQLCETYYSPVEHFVRRYRRHHDDARDLTNAFFAKLLEGNSLGSADPTRGRFRSYLLGAVKHFLSDHQARERSLKRGGGHKTHSLDQPHRTSGQDESAQLEVEAPHSIPADAVFDREWALAVVEQALHVLQAEAEFRGELQKFKILRPWLVTPSGHDTAVKAAQELNLSESAFKVTVHRLRKRFRQAVIDRIATTVDGPNEVQDELNYLIAAMSAPVTIDR